MRTKRNLTRAAHEGPKTEVLGKNRSTTFPQPSTHNSSINKFVEDLKGETTKMNISQAFKSRSMKSMLGDHVLRNGLSRLSSEQTVVKYLPGPSGRSSTKEKGRAGSVIISTMNKLVKRKLSLGAKTGEVEKVFRRIFSVREGEQLLKASQCCLSTTAGPVPGRLFISTDKLAFCSDKAIAKYTSPSGESLRFHYKVVIPITKIKRNNPCNNEKKPSQKYIQVMTKDGFEFWFMGFLNHKKTFKCLQEAVSKGLER